MTRTFGPDPVFDAVASVLDDLERGRPVRERRCVDLKEEAGRRDRAGRLLPGAAENEAAAHTLAGESACMANTPGGGALIVGVADDGTIIGTEIDPEWLRHRIYQLTDRRLTVDVREGIVQGTRILLVVAPPAIEPIRWRNKITWRVDDHCVEVDASTWHSNQRARLQFDWSAQASGLPETAVRDIAIELVRQFLVDSGEPGAADLARTATSDLLRRLGAVTGDGMLTNAAALLLVGREAPMVDYMHRRTAGGDSDLRVHRGSRSAIEQLAEVFTAAQANNPVRHVATGLVIGQLRQLPERAIREAIVNGLAHRDWNSLDPTVIEHVSNSSAGTFTVSSPGGFAHGVRPDNIITHPSKSRNAALTRLLASIRVAEQQGIGVDRMVGDMLKLGFQQPDIAEHDGPRVVTTLVGQAIRESWIRWLRRFDTPDVADDLRLLMIVDTLAARGWIDEQVAARRLQVARIDAVDSLNRIVGITFERRESVCVIDGTPTGSPPAYVLSPAVDDRLSEFDAEAGWRRQRVRRKEIALDYASVRGRISTTELGSLVNAHATNVGSVLKSLADEGLLEPSRENRRGPGFYYRYVGLASDIHDGDTKRRG